MIQLFYKFADRGIEFFFRPRSLGLQLLKYGALILITTLGADIVFGAEYTSPDSSVKVNVGTSGGLPAVAVNGAYALGVLLIFLGIGLLIRQVALDIRKEKRQILIVIELKGLYGAPESPAKDVIMRDFLGQRQSIVLDFRPQRNGELVDRQAVLQKLNGLTTTIEVLAAGRDPADVFLAVGGLAAVPALFLTGVLLDDTANIKIFDWNRNAKVWSVPDGPDDGKRLHPFDTSGLPASVEDVVLVVACSYHVDGADVTEAFPRYPLVRLDAEEHLADRFWSEDKQAVFVNAFRDAVQQLMNMGTKRIHLVLAAPSSLVIRMGMAYDRRLHPNLVAYQYERSLRPAYPWGLVMPPDGQHQATLIETSR